MLTGCVLRGLNAVEEGSVIVREGNLYLVKLPFRNHLPEYGHELLCVPFAGFSIGTQLVANALVELGQFESLALVTLFRADLPDDVVQGRGQLGTQVVGGIARQVLSERVQERAGNIEDFLFRRDAKFFLGVMDKFRVLHNAMA